MKEITDTRLLQLNQLGIIPGPNEGPDEFIKRAEYCLTIKQQLSTTLRPHVPFDSESENDPQILEKGCCKSSDYYDIAPVWVPVFFSNYKLAPWQGGCAWIFQMNEDSPTGVLFQLRENFKVGKSYLGLYNRDELISHELSHVGRMVFEEPKFEELLAYQMSDSKFRRWFGPIVQSSTESMFFVMVIFLIFIADISLVATGYTAAYKTALWIKLIPLVLIGYALLRLWFRHRTYSKCINNLNKLTKDIFKANSIAYRLLDKEIIAFAKMTPNNILEYAKENFNRSLRWQLISKAYLGL